MPVYQLKNYLMIAAESFIKELLHFYFYIIRLYKRESLINNTQGRTLGIISNEYFEKNLGGFGGYGHTARSINIFFELFSNYKWKIKALIPNYYNVKKNPITDSTDKLYLFPAPVSLIFHPVKYISQISKLKCNYFISIDFVVQFEYVFWLIKPTTFIFYFRDPWGIKECKNIATLDEVLKQYNVSDPNYFFRLSERESRAFKRIIRWNKLFKHRILFASNGKFLTEIAVDKFNLNTKDISFLPNPILHPEVIDIKSSKKPTFLFLGRLEAIKRPWIFFELARELPAYHFIVAGTTLHPELSGEWIKNFKNLSNLEFRGLITGEAKVKAFKECWCIINTSIHEGLPVSFQEAFSYGKPVISCVNPDNLTEKFGYFTGLISGNGRDQYSINKFKSKVMECIGDPEQRINKGKAAMEYVGQIHTFEQFESCLEKIINKK